MTAAEFRRAGGVSEADLAVLDRHNDIVVLLDSNGLVTYGNPAAQRRLGYSTNEFVGKHMSDFIHPADLDGAVEAVADLQSGAEITPAIFRLLGGDGAWMPLELSATSHIDSGPFTDTIVVVGRYPGDHDIHMRISQLLTEGAPISKVIAVIPCLAQWRHPDRPYLVMYEDVEGNTAFVGSEVAARLVREHPGEDTPWFRAALSHALVECDPADFPADLQAAAARAGLTRCLVVPVPDPLHGSTALIVAWAVVGGARLSVHRYSIGQMERALTLVLHWRRNIAELERAARSDSLTGLSNRTSFFDHLERKLSGRERRSRVNAEPQPNDDELVGVLYVDLDRFKTINDVYGHGTGDEVLTEVARRMNHMVREGDLLARLGGDEFAVLCVGLHTVDEVPAVAERLLAAVSSEPVEVDGQALSISASIGVAFAPALPMPGGSDALLELADKAMYEAKAAGRNRWVIAPNKR
jgi:diguanylate cyclase (GGDEF)-like protein/PAS domain S-box-containing protein